MNTMKEKNLTREVIVFLIIAFLTFLFISLASYHIDPKENNNIFGIAGYYSGYFINYICGFAGYFLIIFLFFYSIKVLIKGNPFYWDILFFIIFFISFGALLTLVYPNPIIFNGKKIYISGFLIKKLVKSLFPVFSKGGSYFFYFTVLTISGVLLYRISIIEIFSNKKFNFRLFNFSFKFSNNKGYNENEKRGINKIILYKDELNFPDTSILVDPENSGKKDLIKTVDFYKKRLLEKFERLNIKGDIQDIKIGPSIILIEYLPDPSILLSKFKQIQHDLAMALEVEWLRINTPIPGKSTIGIEIPRKERERVFIKEVLNSDEYRNNSSNLPFCIGKNVDGKNVIIDLSDLPHLLIGGSTGSGKSICLHSLILSILFKANINDVRFILIDPKLIEFSLYDGLPHLVFPVITKFSEAINALEWLVDEMQERYKKFSTLKKRDIREFRENEKIPYIVLIIDEFSELIFNNGGVIDTYLIKLVQMGRTAGIHVVISTQRPSSEIITGLIKNCLTSRIALKVNSNYDSRIIIGREGAENLLGKGDMLFLQPGKSLLRLQGTYVSQQDIINVVNFFLEEIDKKRA